MTTYQAAEVTATTDANGYFTYSFANAINFVIAGASTQASGLDTAIVSATAEVTGAKQVTVPRLDCGGELGCQGSQVIRRLL